MRLIDTDELLENLDWLDEYDFVVFKDVKTTIDEIPTVKAIPKGWISEYSRRAISNADYWAIIRMVTAWEKENEKGN